MSLNKTSTNKKLIINKRSTPIEIKNIESYTVEVKISVSALYFDQIDYFKSIFKNFSGGVKSVFTIEENEYALISNKKNDCFYASVINLLNLATHF